MEEDIKILEEMKNNCLTKRDYIDEKAERKAQAIENLINKYKEQKRDIRDNHILLAKYSQKNEEQEKVIELMAEKLAIYKFEEIICMETECEHIELQNEGKCIGDKECILEYFKKKVRE